MWVHPHKKANKLFKKSGITLQTCPGKRSHLKYNLPLTGHMDYTSHRLRNSVLKIWVYAWKDLGNM